MNLINVIDNNVSLFLAGIQRSVERKFLQHTKFDNSDRALDSTCLRNYLPY